MKGRKPEWCNCRFQNFTSGCKNVRILTFYKNFSICKLEIIDTLLHRFYIISLIFSMFLCAITYTIHQMCTINAICTSSQLFQFTNNITQCCSLSETIFSFIIISSRESRIHQLNAIGLRFPLRILVVMTLL